MNKTKDGWYTPLAAQFQGIDEPMPLARFAAIEAVLHLLALNAPATDPAKAYLLFTQYQLIGTTACTAIGEMINWWMSAACRLGCPLVASRQISAFARVQKPSP